MQIMITSERLQDGAITSSKLRDGAITSSKIRDGALTFPKPWDDVQLDAGHKCGPILFCPSGIQTPFEFNARFDPAPPPPRNCPNCGAPGEMGRHGCAYCGTPYLGGNG